MRESLIESYLTRRVNALGGLSLKWTSPGHVGVPDRLLFFKGTQPYLVELKRPGGALSAVQKQMHQMLLQRGQTVYVLSSKEEVDSFIEALVAERLGGMLA